VSGYVVEQAHTKSYADPLVVQKDEIVALGQRDDEWPGWTWCIGSAGKGGWLPEQILERSGGKARVRETFDTSELTVDVAEIITGGPVIGGWQWCRQPDGGEGWVPVRCLREQPEKS